MKDNFSAGSDKYAQYRPIYPVEFFDYLKSIVPVRQNAWDCGTGNGQVAYELSGMFDNVFATDISQAQIDNARKAVNITYSVQPAEQTNFEDRQFDLIVVAQAIHWFDFEKFYAEVIRTAKENAFICVVGYGRIEITEQIDNTITGFYNNVIGPYWDKERKYIDEGYKTILFPFKEIQAPKFVNRLHWTFEHLIGYLNTWSAVKHFIKKNGYNPIDKLQSELKQYWAENQVIEVRFSMLVRVGQITQALKIY